MWAHDPCLTNQCIHLFGHWDWARCQNVTKVRNFAGIWGKKTFSLAGLLIKTFFKIFVYLYSLPPAGERLFENVYSIIYMEWRKTKLRDGEKQIPDYIVYFHPAIHKILDFSFLWTNTYLFCLIWIGFVEIHRKLENHTLQKFRKFSYFQQWPGLIYIWVSPC